MGVRGNISQKKPRPSLDELRNWFAKELPLVADSIPLHQVFRCQRVPFVHGDGSLQHCVGLLNPTSFIEAPAQVVHETLIPRLERHRGAQRRDRLIVESLVARAASDALMKDGDVGIAGRSLTIQRGPIGISRDLNEKIARLINDLKKVFCVPERRRNSMQPLPSPKAWQNMLCA